MLPDQGTTTQIMILLNLFDEVDKPSTIAKSIGITIQGVQYHVKILKNKGYISESNEITKEGYNFLETGLNSMRDFISENIAKLDDIVTWEAIADETLKKGDPVSVYMDNGYLHAGRGGNGAKGIVKNTAGKDEIAAVSSMSGIVNFKFGLVKIVVLPDVENLSDETLLIERIRNEHQENGGKIAIVGEEAYLMIMKSSLRIDIEFASLHGVFEAAARGIFSTLYISPRRFHYLLSDLRELQNKYKEVTVKIKYL